MTDEARGLAALRAFFNMSAQNFGSKFPYANFDLFYDAVRQTKGARFIAEGLGLTIVVNNMSDSQVTSAMSALARQAQGRLPSNLNGWFQALSNEAAKINFLDAAVYVTTESAADVVKGAQAVGDAVVDTGKSFLAVGPLALLAAGLFILYRKSKSI